MWNETCNNISLTEHKTKDKKPKLLFKMLKALLSLLAWLLEAAYLTAIIIPWMVIIITFGIYGSVTNNSLEVDCLLDKIFILLLKPAEVLGRI